MPPFAAFQGGVRQIPLFRGGWIFRGVGGVKGSARRPPPRLGLQGRRHVQQQPIGRGGGERRQPLRLSLGEGTFHQPASGLGQGGAHGLTRSLDPLPQLAAEAEGGSGAEQRQGAGGGSRGGGDLCPPVNT